MPWQPSPKMHLYDDVSQVRSQRITSDSSAGFTNSTYARGKTRSTSGTPQPYVHQRHALVGWAYASGRPRHRVQHPRGAAPPPGVSQQGPLGLAEPPRGGGAVSQQGVDALAAFTAGAQRV